MKTLRLSYLIICFLLCHANLLEVAVKRSIHPSFTLGAIENATAHSPISTRAVVIGASTYQDSQLPQLPSYLKNAELYAAFLRSREGGLLPSEHLQLLTGEQATMARFTTAIGWLEEESKRGDHISVFFGGNARLINSDLGPVPYLFLADSPIILGSTGSMPLAKFCYLVQGIAQKKNLGYSLIFDLNMGTTTAGEDDMWRQWLEALQKSFPYAHLQETLNKSNNSKEGPTGFTPLLLEGLLGQADANGNEQIMPTEAAKYLRKEHKKAPGGSALLMAFSDEKKTMAVVDKTQYRPNYSNQSKFPLIVGQEMSRMEDSLLAMTDARTRRWYEDFILTKKLGALMAPVGRCTSDLYDSLMTVSFIQPLHSHLRRQLAAALQDETQQALNDYLRTDTRELQSRWKYSAKYAVYPKYMQRVVELLGEGHFMYNIIQCKKYYFEGLTARLDYQKTEDNEHLKKAQLLHEAIEKQTFSLTFEPDAAFVLNELGILHILQGSNSAKSYFMQAINLAPQWGIPYLNISIFFQKENNIQLDSALSYAHIAVNLTPWNPVAVHNIGRVYFKLKNFEEAYTWLLHAASLDPTDNSIYYDLSCTKAQQGETEAAIQWLEMAFKYEYKTLDELQKDQDLHNIKTNSKYIQLLNKYFPAKAKN